MVPHPNDLVYPQHKKLLVGMIKDITDVVSCKSGCHLFTKQKGCGNGCGQ